MALRMSPKFVIAVSLLVAGLAVLFGVGLKGSLVYYLTVGEFLDQHGGRALNDNFRINGNVVEGSIEKSPDALGARFLMTDGSRELPVTYSKETPDTFVDGSEVVVEGTLRDDGVFVAHTLLAKCPSKYEAANQDGDYQRAESPEGGAATADP
jgi:cytochrome c-type biogenesis protein CcmE